MNHYSEHILELFVRNSRDVEQEREAISRHVDSCAGCRALVEEMSEFYSRSEDSKKLLSESSTDDGSLVLEPHIGRRAISASYISNSLPARVIRYMKQQPFKSSLFTMGIFVLGLYTINTISSNNESNPWYFEYNINSNSIDIYDKNDTKLWGKRLREDITKIDNFEKTNAFHQSLVADIDQDGKNEVVILSNLASDRGIVANLKIFDGDGNIKEKNILPFKRVRYKTKQYETEFIPTSVIFGGNKEKNLFVSFQNGRSPSVVVRYDENGKIIGTYWHYGQLIQMMFFDVDRDGYDELVLNGINDTEDETVRSYAVTVIVDPDKIIGNCESSATKGFGFASSDAELRYIRYPNPEIILQSTINLFAKNELYREGDTIFRVLTEAKQDEVVAIEYYFDSTFAVTDAKFAGQTLIYHNRLYKEGKLKQPINDEYITSLKRAVLYWNGTNWGNRPTTIVGQVSLQ